MPPKARNRARLTVYAVSCVLFLIGAAIALLVTRGYALEFETLTLQKRGLIVLNSQPDSAEIRVSGEVREERTDSRISLEPGRHAVEIRHPGRVPWLKTFELESGEALIEELILFPEDPQREFLTESRVVRLARSAGGDWLAAVTTKGELVVFDAKLTVRTVVRLPAALRSPRALAISEDGATAVGNRDRTVLFLAGGQRIASFAGTDARLVTGRVVFARGQRLYVAEADGRSPRVIATRPHGFLTTAERIFLIDRKGSLVSLRPGGTAERVEGTGPAASIAPLGPNAIFFTERDGDGGILSGLSWRLVRSGIESSALTPDGAYLAYRTSRELRIRELGAEDRLVTSLTDPPERIQALPGGYYLLFRRGSELRTMYRDGSNERTVATGIGRDPLFFGLDRVVVTDAKSGRLLKIDLES